MGGGIPEGSFGIFSGPPKCGKTTTGLQIIANAVKPEYASELKPNGREAYIFNVEGRLKKRDLLGIHGMKRSFLEQYVVHLIESSPGNILSGEDYIEIAETLINEKPSCVFLFDSFSQLCTKARRDSDVSWTDLGTIHLY